MNKITEQGEKLIAEVMLDYKKQLKEIAATTQAKSERNQAKIAELKAKLK